MNFKIKIVVTYFTIVLLISLFLLMPVQHQVEGIAIFKNSSIIVTISQNKGLYRSVLHKGDLIHLIFESNLQTIHVSGVIQLIDSSFSTVYVQPVVQLKTSITSAGNSFLHVPVRISLKPKNVLASILEK